MISPYDMKGTHALVVGGYGGIGSAICELLAAHGAVVAVAGRSADRAAELATRLTKDGGDATAVPLDVTSRDSILGALAHLEERWPAIDVVVNCAGVLVTGPAEDLAEQDWLTVVEANLTGAFRLSQETGRLMIRKGTAGRIIHLSSVRSWAGGRRGFAAYGPSKAGVNLLVKQLAAEWGRFGITVNAVAPGFVRTELVDGAAQDQRFLEMIAARTPLGRLADPEEIAGAVLFFASPLARFVTGQILFVDGGVTASQ